MKVLIISYHSLPMDVIASYRTMAYFNHFKKWGIEPVLLTHHWGKTQHCTGVQITHLDSGTIIRIPAKKHTINRLTKQVEKISGLNKVSILVRWLRGILDPNPADWNSYRSMKTFCSEHLKKNRYDVLLGIFSPHHHLKLCYELHKKFGVPYVLDFRDLWNNRIIHRKYSPGIIQGIQDRLTRYYWKKWLSRALFFSITSEYWMNKIREFSQTKGIVVQNGFDPDMFENSEELITSTDEFVILYTGTLYTHQRLDIFLQGCQLFIESQKPEKFKVKFIGADREGFPGQISGFMYRPKEFIGNYLGENICQISERIPKTEVISLMNESQLLLFPGLPDSPGTYLGKIFDYLAIGKNILMVPDDHSVVGELIRETNSGFIANTPEEVNKVLTSCYQRWKELGSLSYQGNQGTILQYTRENQVRKTAETILKLIRE